MGPLGADGLAPSVTQIHSSEYRAPDQLPPGDVLVVGGGNSGVQIAAELAETRCTALAIGERLTRLPQVSRVDPVQRMDQRREPGEHAR